MLSRLLITCLFGLALNSLHAQQAGGHGAPLQRPQGPCDIYGAAGDPCAAAHSTTRALYASYNGPLYQVLRQSDGKTLDIGVVEPDASNAGGYANAAAQDKFCADTHCWITTIYDQSPQHNDMTQAPRGGFNGPAMGGFNNLPIADMAPATIQGHKVYGVFIEPGMGLRKDDVKGTAVDDQAQGQYWVVNGRHYNSGCCFDYGNAEIDSRDDDNGTMETTYFGSAGQWFQGSSSGPWIMTDQENNLVGCVNANGQKGCPNLPSIPWRFVTAMGKGEPHHWTTLGGDSQRGSLSVMFSGPRVNATYDPMRKQGAILLGNGGDNSNSSQGTFYEGAMTAGGTFPSDSTDQLVQANVVAARYDVQPLSLAPASEAATPPGLQTFSPGSSQNATVTFTNTTSAAASQVELSISVPNHQWTSVLTGSSEGSKTFPEPVRPGGSVNATFKVTSGPTPWSGDLVAHASWTSAGDGTKRSETAVEKVRNTSPVRINEFRISSGPPANSTDSFIELYNPGADAADLSGWTLTLHPAQQAVFSSVKIPGGTRIAGRGFYLLGLANSGLAVPARAGETAIHVRSTAGMTAGDTISIGSGADMETRKIASIGSAAGTPTTVWQPLPDGPVITVPAGSSNVPVASTSGFAVGEKIALGHGATYPVAAGDLEQYEVATVTAVGKAGTQAYLAVDAPAGATNIKVTSLQDISAGDKIRLDIDSKGHGIDMVTVTKVGTQAGRTNLAANTAAGATNVKVRAVTGFSAGDKATIGTPANGETVTIIEAGTPGPEGTGLSFTPALTHAHINDEWVVTPGTGLELAAPLRFNHAANLPFSNRGTGISFEPATAFPHSSNEPVQALGTGIRLDRALAGNHPIHTAVRDANVTTAGYQGKPEPDEWFGGPELFTVSPLFGRLITVREGSLVLQDAAGIMVDSLNYGGMVDPWVAQGYQAASGIRRGGCYAPAPGRMDEAGGPASAAGATNSSAGRMPDGADSGSNCADYLTQAATTLPLAAAAGATNIKVASIEGFYPGQKVMIDSGANLESAVIASIGTAGASNTVSATSAGAKTIPVAGVSGFANGQSITIGEGANEETAVIASVRRFGGSAINVVSPLRFAHESGDAVSGSGITLKAALTRGHASGTAMTDNVPTPGAPNMYSTRVKALTR